MDTHENYRQRGMGEGNPGNINPNEINANTPDKAISETEKLERRESALGINQSKRASAENLDQQLSQIDEGTKEMKQENKAQQREDSTNEKQFDTDDFKRVDERDTNDSSEDWDAEKNRTGRQK